MTLQGGAGSPWGPGGQGPSPPVPSGLPLLTYRRSSPADQSVPDLAAAPWAASLHQKVRLSLLPAAEPQRGLSPWAGQARHLLPGLVAPTEAEPDQGLPQLTRPSSPHPDAATCPVSLSLPLRDAWPR